MIPLPECGESDDTTISSWTRRKCRTTAKYGAIWDGKNKRFHDLKLVPLCEAHAKEWRKTNSRHEYKVLPYEEAIVASIFDG